VRGKEGPFFFSIRKKRRRRDGSGKKAARAERKGTAWKGFHIGSQTGDAKLLGIGTNPKGKRKV